MIKDILLNTLIFVLLCDIDFDIMNLKRIIYTTCLSVILGFGASVSMSPLKAQVQQTQTENFITHTVVSGETVYSLSKKYNVLMQDIYDHNPEAKKGIKGGEVLRIPTKSAHAPSVDQSNKGFSSPYGEYRVSKGETIFSIARANEISEETLRNLNPELKDGLKEGMVLKIPRKQIQPMPLHPLDKVTSEDGKGISHTVVAGETLYGISKKYGVGIDALYVVNPSLSEGLKTGSTLIIPTSSAIANTVQPVPSANFVGKVVRVGVLLPFLDNKGTVQKEKLVEYYEGFLLAVRDLKESGVNIEVMTFDTGLEKDTKRLISILGTSEASSLDVLIGGTSQQQIDILTDFSQKMGVRYVIPFGGVKQNSVLERQNVYQMVTPLSSLFNSIAKTFVQKYKGNNIIFVEEIGSDNNKKSFIAELKKELKANGVDYKELRESSSLISELGFTSSKTKNNIIIPTSASELSLQRIIRAMDAAEEGISYSLFGYPEWQTYNKRYNDLHKYDATIYSTFYLNESDMKVQSVMNQYRKWYNKPIAWSFPRYAFLGYDTGLFFIKGVNQKKSNFDSEVSLLRIPTLQSAMHYTVREDGSGFVNTGYYFVRFKKDSSVEKTEYK